MFSDKGEGREGGKEERMKVKVIERGERKRERERGGTHIQRERESERARVNESH